jgi:putative flippase GtrA
MDAVFRRIGEDVPLLERNVIHSLMSALLSHRSVRTHASQLWKFIICGGIGFVLDLSSLTFFVEYLDIVENVAVVLSSLVGATFAFIANKFFTFRNREKSYGNQALKFALVYGISIVANGLISNALLWVGLHYILAKIIAVGIGALWNYALSHGFVFKKHSEQGDVVIS